MSQIQATEDEIGNAAVEINFAGEILLLDACGVIYFPAHSIMLVSDLHFEKASYFASKRSPLPLYDTLETLSNLKNAISKYSPKKIICMGDSFHDFNAGLRINQEDADSLNGLCNKCEWIWILGNHDKFFPENIKGMRVDDFKLGEINLSHEPTGAQYEIIGHFHPKARISLHEHRITGRAFIYDESLLIMPSFGSFTGGLYINSPVITSLFKAKPKTYMIYNKKIWRI